MYESGTIGAKPPHDPAVDRRRRAGRDRRRGGVGARDLQLLAPGRRASTSASSAPPSSTGGATSTPPSSARTTRPTSGCRAPAGRPRSRRRAGGWLVVMRQSPRAFVERVGLPHLAGRPGDDRHHRHRRARARPDRRRAGAHRPAPGRHRRRRPGPPPDGTWPSPTTWARPPRRPTRSWPCCGTSRPRRARRRERAKRANDEHSGLPGPKGRALIARIPKGAPMRAFAYEALPGRVVFGTGSRAQLPAELDALGARRVLARGVGRRGRGRGRRRRPAGRPRRRHASATWSSTCRWPAPRRPGPPRSRRAPTRC